MIDATLPGRAAAATCPGKPLFQPAEAEDENDLTMVVSWEAGAAIVCTPSWLDFSASDRYRTQLRLPV